MSIPLAIVLKGYPRLSETFIAQEIRSLELAGFDITIYSLRHPTDRKIHPVHEEIEARVEYLPEYLYQQPLRVLKSVWKVWGRVRESGVLRTWWQDFKRDFTANRVRRLGQGLVLAAELPDHITRVYVHFLHTPASATRYACMIRKLPWACSAHAKDIWTTPQWELSEKLVDCRWLTTCTRANTEYLQTLTQDKNKVSLNYHGLDLNRFACDDRQFSNRSGDDPEDPVVILSVGRAVEKKGYGHLLEALSRLLGSLQWRFVHIGGGPLLDSLKQSAHGLGIAPKIEWLGPQPQETVLQHYRQSDFFVLNCEISDDGDRDGLPNVLVEAQSQGLAVISTNISGIPELVRDDVNGLLLEPGDNTQLTEAIETLITSPQTRERMGRAGYEIVTSEFDMQSNHLKLHQLLKEL